MAASSVTDALLPRAGDEELGSEPALSKVTWKTETQYLIGLSAPAIVQLAAQQVRVQCIVEVTRWQRQHRSTFANPLTM